MSFVVTPNGAKRPAGPRIVLYCVEPNAYRLLRAWAERSGFTFRLIVTTPGPARARNVIYRDIIAEAPPDQDILVTTGMRRIAPMIAALDPDLILSFTFPYRIPPEVLALPRHGAVNLHPAPLPAYRGPNPARMVYNGEPLLGATLHRTEADFDTGPILSRQVAPLPADVSQQSVLETWERLIVKALEEGVPRALADEPGTPQDSSLASYAASFTDEDMWLDWNVPAAVLKLRVAALNLLTPQAKAVIGGREYLVDGLANLPDAPPRAEPGTVLERFENAVKVQTAEGIALLSVMPIA
ncbi:MAG: Methionyl-tRNA formyltransferase [Chloroflexi bacterium]|nr:Methionyl-tRNA formyltransferase [Chloroflexota bacterium]